jgi:hypothetical protein
MRLPKKAGRDLKRILSHRYEKKAEKMTLRPKSIFIEEI